MGMKRNNRKASKRQIFAAFELKNINFIAIDKYIFNWFFDIRNEFRKYG